MRLVETDHGLVLNQPTEGYIRTPGLHLSDIYNQLYAELDPARFAKGGGPDAVKMEMGSAFEEVLEIALAHRMLAERPGEFACLPSGRIVPVGSPNSIIFSPDQFLFNGVTRLGEFKATWMSIRQGIQDKRFDKWWTQVKGYCYPLQLLHARLYVLFVNGDYSYRPPNGGAVLKCYDIEFTQHELDTNWSMLMRFAARKGMITL